MAVAKQGLEIKGLTKTYKNGQRALDGVDLHVTPGLYGLLGPNGAGKSSLMRTLATLQLPDRGAIQLDGIDVLADPNYLRQRLGYLPQHVGAYPGVSARKLLARFAWLKGRTDAKERDYEVDALLERVNLSHVSHRTVATYSGGMLRRFGIAMALIGSPRLVIVDEPTAGLDPAERNRFHRVLADVAEGAVVLLSTHIVEDIENLCSRLAVLAKGQILAEGSPQDLVKPLEGKLWTRVVPRGEPIPPAALNAMAAPSGTKIIVHGAVPPSDAFSVRNVCLEDAYSYALAQAGLGDVG